MHRVMGSRLWMTAVFAWTTPACLPAHSQVGHGVAVALGVRYVRMHLDRESVQVLVIGDNKDDIGSGLLRSLLPEQRYCGN